jgi:hypothetical protein
MCNLYKEPSVDASYQVSVHLAKGFQRRRLKCEKLTDDGHQKLTLPLSITKFSHRLILSDKMNRNLVGSIYGRSSIKLLISSRPINKYGHHRQFLFLIGWFSLKIFSETACSNQPKLDMKHLCKVLYKISSFSPDPLINMATTANSCFGLVDF